MPVSSLQWELYLASNQCSVFHLKIIATFNTLPYALRTLGQGARTFLGKVFRRAEVADADDDDAARRKRARARELEAEINADDRAELSNMGARKLL